MNGSWRIGRIFGISVEVHYTWLVVFFLVVMYLNDQFGRFAVPSGVQWLLSLLTAVVFFASVLAHELAHSVVANRDGPMVERITLFVFGGVAHLKREPARAGVEFAIALAGPVMSLCLAGVFGGLLIATMVLPPSLQIIRLALQQLAVINLMLAGFNMIPAFPLDGGRVLRAVLWGGSRSFDYATRIAAGIGQAFGYVFMAIGFMIVIGGNWLQGFWLVAIGWMLTGAAQSSVRRLEVEAALAGVRVADIMTSPAVSVEPEWPLHRVVYEVILPYRLSSVPVTAAGRPVGLLELHDVQSVPQDQLHLVTVAHVMRPLSPEALASPFDEAAKALARMAGEGGRVYVVSPDGMLAGVVGHRDLMQAVQIGMTAPGLVRPPAGQAGGYYRYPVEPVQALTGIAPPPAVPGTYPAPPAPPTPVALPAEPTAATGSFEVPEETFSPPSPPNGPPSDQPDTAL